MCITALFIDSGFMKNVSSSNFFQQLFAISGLGDLSDAYEESNSS